MSGIDDLRRGLARVLIGKPEAIELLLVGLLAEGHVLLEDVPGVGKTTLAKAVARLCSLRFSRVQFTPDLLPGDIVGSQVLQPGDGSFRFLPGPVFTEILLADEINRASPRTQAALLEAMSERQVTVEGETHALERPFFVLATQNPVDFQGTYPLPEAQLDRFLLRFAIGYPDLGEETRLLLAHQEASPLESVGPVCDRAALLELHRQVRSTTVKPAVAEYIVRWAQATREHAQVELGLSPRGSLAVFRAAQAWAVLQGRDYVSPDDVQALAPHVMAHRLALTEEARYAGKTAAALVHEIGQGVAVPV